MTTTVERKYALTKIAAGDYLLPSNDARTLWRFRQYEDGPSHGLEVDWADRKFWRVERWHEEIAPFDRVDIESFDRWICAADMFESRREAIEWAMSR